MKRLAIVIAVVLVSAPLAAAAEPEGLSAFERARREAEVMRQRTVAKVREQLANVGPMVAARRFAEADLCLQTARRLVKTSNELPAAEQASLMAEIDLMAQGYAAQKAAYLQAREAQTAKEVAEREHQRRMAEQLFAERRTASQWARLQEYRSRREYDLALDEAKAILASRPDDHAAWKQSWDLEYLSDLSRRLDTRYDRHRETALALTDSERAGVPWTELHRYPPAKEWQEMSNRRLSRLARQLGYAETSAVSQVGLQKRIDLNVSDVSLTNVIVYLAEASGVTIVMDPHIQADTGIDPASEPVTLNVKSLTLEQLLTMILPSEMGWRVDEDHVVVSSREKANPLKTITYPIQHLVAEIPNFDNAPKMEMGNVSADTGSGGSASPLFPDQITDVTDTTPPQDKIKDLIIRFVKSTDPRIAAWEDEGGTATIEYFNGTLIISQTETGHRKIAALLARL